MLRARYVGSPLQASFAIDTVGATRTFTATCSDGGCAGGEVVAALDEVVRLRFWCGWHPLRVGSSQLS